MADTPRSYYVKRLGGGEPLRRNRVDIRPTRETFQNFKRQSAINEEDEEVISAGPEGMDTEVGNNMCGNNVDDQNDIELPELPELPSLPAQGETAVRRSIRVRKETQFYKP